MIDKTLTMDKLLKAKALLPEPEKSPFGHAVILFHNGEVHHCNEFLTETLYNTFIIDGWANKGVTIRNNDETN